MTRSRFARATALIAMTSAACVSTEGPGTSSPGPAPAAPGDPTPAPAAPTPATPGAPTTYAIPGTPASPTAPDPARRVPSVPATPTMPSPTAPGSPTTRPPPPGTPPGPQLGPRRPYPEGAIDLPCTLRAEIEPTIVRDELRLRFVLSNLGGEPATVTLRGTCPGGMVELRGLPTGFDPMHRCQAGACVKPTATATYTVPAHKTVTIGETTLRGSGDACNPRLPLGSTLLSAAITPDTPRFDTCTGGTIHIVRDPKTGKLRRAGLLEPRVPATPPSPQPRPQPTQKPTQKPTPSPAKHCPVCAFGCPNGIPSREVGPDGCPSCSCERLDPITR